MEHHQPEHIHFIGAGGVGMAGLAHLVADFGDVATGSDAVDSAMLSSLRRRGLWMHVGALERLPEGTDLVVYSSAIGHEHPELVDARRRGIRCIRRGEYLGELAKRFKRVIAVAGSHGKTSTCAMLAHICREAGLCPGYLIGGQVQGWDRSATAGGRDVFVTEVDESDGTQVYTRASLGIIINIEDDHCWSHGGEAALRQCFATFAERAHEYIAWRGVDTETVLRGLPHGHFIDGCDIPSGLTLPQPGMHNRVNGTLAMMAARWLGVAPEESVKALATFPGVSRRMSVRGKSSDGGVVLIEDYAHHPTELRATLSALREGYGDRELLVVFQPHRHERVKRYGREFSDILSQVCHSWIVEPFSAWVDDGSGEGARRMASDIANGRGEYIACDPSLVTESVLSYVSRCEGRYVVAVIGAGDVGKIVPVLSASLSRL